MNERARRIVGFALAMVAVAAFFVLLLGVGFALNPPDTLGLAGDIRPAAAALLGALAGLGLVVRSLKGTVSPPLRHLPPQRPGSRAEASDARLAYARDVTRLATCPHLNAIERDLRATGIPVRLRYGNVVIADCQVDEVLLRQRYAILPPLRFLADMPGDRPGSPATAALSCHEHSSVIEVVPRAEAGPATRVFPTD